MNALTCPHCGEPYPARSIVCPKCGSDEIAVQGRKGFSTGKALVGAILVGPLGVAAGGLHHQNILLTCSNCGYSWQATPQQLQAQLVGKPRLESGTTMTGVVRSVNKFGFNPEYSLTVDLGSGQLGTLRLDSINRSRRRRGLTPIAQGDSIEVLIKKPSLGNLGIDFGYMLKLVDRWQLLSKEKETYADGTIDDIKQQERQKNLTAEEKEAQRLELMEKYGITFDGTKYIYQTYRYGALQDALNYAKLASEE